ncbi:MAG: Ribosomal RNA small subunit methyltransferase B [Eubacteriales bacterium SKADARSKE-1]|nr:Ribosomal RNA small subunit methyltransferase B [Eubacteriales bacterium SKADARSKE-1]
MSNARETAFEALLKVEKEEAYSNIVLNNIIKISDLSSKDISLCSAIFYGVLEKKLTLNYIISKYSKMPIKKLSIEVLLIFYIGIYQLFYMNKIPKSAAVNESVKLSKCKKLYSAAGFINGILRSIVRDGTKLSLDDLEENSLKYLSIKYSCPEWIISMWQSSYGDQCTIGILKSLEIKVPINIRVNTLKTTKKELMNILVNEGLKVCDINLLENSLEISGTGSIESLKSFKDGLFHVQDISSQICCKILDPKPGYKVADVCAAPGGKSFTIAELMKNNGEILSFDLYEQKVNLIKNGAKRLGIEIIKSKVKDAKLPMESGTLVDRVLCDAPCSGFGIIRRKPEIRYKDKDLFKDLPKLQYEILSASEKKLKPSGTLVYSTCTLNQKENGEVADKFLIEHKNYEPLPILLEGVDKAIDEPKNQLTLMPHIHNTDGFFIACFRKLSD